MDKQRSGDVSGPSEGDISTGAYPDWDNPEDFDEDAPEGYYDEDEDEDGGYVPGPDDPDYDLSEAHGYAGWEAPANGGLLPQWAVAAFCIVVILAIVGGLLISVS